jgi:beta-1,4-mannooligosaccharide/beta-1,4-mannosyl-N-acetylglucosamine phosphorylase
MEEPFVRCKKNPLITARDLHYQANAVFNAGAADLGDEVLLLVRVESCSGRSHLIVARSKDGIGGWEFAEKALLHSDENFPYEAYGVEDCRVTRMEDLDCWGLAYTAYSPYGPGVALATTKDFKSVNRLGVIFPPDDKNAALFPRKFGGLYAILHRPSVGGGNIWLSYSPDLIFWGRSELVIPVRSGPWWDGVRVGAGLPPIETKAGWLVIYHGVKELAGNPIYRLGAALLHKDKPHKLIARARRWLLSPQEPYERSGDAPNVVFACGGFVRGDELWMYYGAADSSICLARAKMSQVLNFLEEESLKGA